MGGKQAFGLRRESGVVKIRVSTRELSKWTDSQEKGIAK